MSNSKSSSCVSTSDSHAKHTTNKGAFIKHVTNIISIHLLPEIETEEIETMVIDNVKIFDAAFTSDKKIATSGMNYQLLEKIGDSMISNCMIRILKKKGFVTESSITNVTSNVCSSHYQPTLAKKLGLDRLIDTSDIFGKEINKTLEDVLEAFIGALSEALEASCGLGEMYVHMYSAVEYMYSDLEITPDSKYAHKRPKQILKEAFESHTPNLGKPKFTYISNANGTHTVEIYRKIKIKGKTGDLKYVCKQVGYDILDTEIKAVDEAMRIFNITLESIAQKQKDKKENQDIIELQDKINIITSCIGYNGVSYEHKTIGKDMMIWIFIKKVNTDESFCFYKSHIKNYKNVEAGDEALRTPIGMYTALLEMLLEKLRKAETTGTIEKFLNDNIKEFHEGYSIEKVKENDDESNRKSRDISERRDNNPVLSHNTMHTQGPNPHSSNQGYTSSHNRNTRGHNFSRGEHHHRGAYHRSNEQHYDRHDNHYRGRGGRSRGRGDMNRRPMRSRGGYSDPALPF